MKSAAALASLVAPPMIVHSDLLGPLTYEPEDVITVPVGLLGFPDCREFLLLPCGEGGLHWLQSIDSSALAFLLVDPFPYFDGYEVNLSPADLADLGAGSAPEIAVLAIVTLPRTRSEPLTANLLGPVALNFASRRAKQLAISESEFSVRTPFRIQSLQP